MHYWPEPLSTSLEPGPVDPAPYLLVRNGPDGMIAEGTPDCRLGALAAGAPLLPGDVHAEWRFTAAEGVQVRNCRYGFYPLYYFADSERFGISPSLPKLLELGAPTPLNDTAMAVFLRLGFLVGDMTVFAGIQALPPHAELTWATGRLNLTATPYRVAPQNLSRDAAIDGYIELFRQAVRRRLPPGGNFAVPLSGGRDSRHVLLELVAAGHKPAFTLTTHEFPPYSSEDIRVAGLLSQRLGVPHVALRQPSHRARAEFEKHAITNFSAMEHAWALVVGRHLAGRTPLVYDGLCGDFLSNGAQLKRPQVELFEQGRYEDIARMLLSGWLNYRGYDAALEKIMVPGLARRFSFDAAVHCVAEAVARQADAPNPMSAYQVWNRARRGIAQYTFGLFPQFGIHPVTPFLDHDVFDFLSSLPSSMFLDHTFHTEAIHRAHPDHAEVPFEDKTVPKRETSWHFRRLLLESAGYITRYGSGRFLNRKYLVPRLIRMASDPTIHVRKRKSYLAPFAALFLARLEYSLSRAKSRH